MRREQNSQNQAELSKLYTGKREKIIFGLSFNKVSRSTNRSWVPAIVWNSNSSSAIHTYRKEGRDPSKSENAFYSLLFFWKTAKQGTVVFL